MEKLKTALYFGADAVYLAGKRWGLRAFADNFDEDELLEAVKVTHRAGKKLYVTVNVFARNADFSGLKDYLLFIEKAGADAVIAGDPGVIDLILKTTRLPVHVSTQANVTNGNAAAFWRDIGARRVILARELTIYEIRETAEYLKGDIELEAFVHGSMCVSYSGRCLLSDYLSGRPSNRGECAQSCRWRYALCESSRPGQYFPIEEDGNGAYILNSRDLNMLPYIGELAGAGVSCFKIEGRVKSAYYVAGATDAYRRALELYDTQGKDFVCPPALTEELNKISHREYGTGFYFGRPLESYACSKPVQTYDFTAVVTGSAEGGVWVEMRSRFKRGDLLEVLSPGLNGGRSIAVGRLEDENGLAVEDAYLVQQRLLLYTELKLSAGDILRKKL